MMNEVNDEEECEAVYGDTILDAFQTQDVTGAVVSLVPGQGYASGLCCF